MPKKHQNDPRSGQKRPQNDPKTTKKAIPNDKTKKGPNQDDPKTVLDRHGAETQQLAQSRKALLGGQNGTKIDPKTIKNRSEKSRVKKTDLERAARCRPPPPTRVLLTVRDEVGGTRRLRSRS